MLDRKDVPLAKIGSGFLFSLFQPMAKTLLYRLDKQKKQLTSNIKQIRTTISSSNMAPAISFPVKDREDYKLWGPDAKEKDYFCFCIRSGRIWCFFCRGLYKDGQHFATGKECDSAKAYRIVMKFLETSAAAHNLEATPLSQKAMVIIHDERELILTNVKKSQWTIYTKYVVGTAEEKDLEPLYKRMHDKLGDSMYDDLKGEAALRANLYSRDQYTVKDEDIFDATAARTVKQHVAEIEKRIAKASVKYVPHKNKRVRVVTINEDGNEFSDNTASPLAGNTTTSPSTANTTTSPLTANTTANSSSTSGGGPSPPSLVGGNSTLGQSFSGGRFMPSSFIGGSSSFGSPFGSQFGSTLPAGGFSYGTTTSAPTAGGFSFGYNANSATMSAPTNSETTTTTSNTGTTTSNTGAGAKQTGQESFWKLLPIYVSDVMMRAHIERRVQEGNFKVAFKIIVNSLMNDGNGMSQKEATKIAEDIFFEFDQH